MKHPKVLLVFYSATGHTRAIADELAAELGATVVQISCPSLDHGGCLAMRRFWSALTRSKPAIRLSSVEEVDQFDLVLIGGPIWVSRLATPVTHYLDQEANRLPAVVGLFLSSATTQTADAIAQWTRCVGRKPVATLCISDDDRVTGKQVGRIQEFITAVQTFLASQRSAKAALPLV